MVDLSLTSDHQPSCLKTSMSRHFVRPCRLQVQGEFVYISSAQSRQRTCKQTRLVLASYEFGQNACPCPNRNYIFTSCMFLLHQLCSSARWPNGRRITSFHHLRLICKTLFYWFVSLWLPAIFHQFRPRWQDGKTFWNKSQPNQWIKKNIVFLSARLFGILEMWQI